MLEEKIFSELKEKESNIYRMISHIITKKFPARVEKLEIQFSAIDGTEISLAILPMTLDNECFEVELIYSANLFSKKLISEMYHTELDSQSLLINSLIRLFSQPNFQELFSKSHLVIGLTPEDSYQYYDLKLHKYLP